MSEKEKEAIVEEQQQDISELLQIRRDKLSALQAEGNNPFFVNTCDKDISAQEIHDRFEELEGKDVCIAGRIMSWRDMGKASFMDIHDRSGRMQVYLKIDEVGEDVYKGLSNWDLGKGICVQNTPRRNFCTCKIDSFAFQIFASIA